MTTSIHAAPMRIAMPEVLVPEAGYTVKLTYFKPSGKYYSSGTYQSHQPHTFQIYEEVRRMVDQKELPGLLKGVSGYTVLVEIPEHPYDVPALVHPEHGARRDH